MDTRARDGIVRHLPSNAEFPTGATSREGRDPFAVDIRAWLGLFRRQIKLLLGTVFVVCAITALVLFQIPPKYTSTALLLVDPRQQTILDPGAQVGVSPGDQGMVESEVEMLRSPSVFLHVIQAKNLFNDPEFAPRPGWRQLIQSVFGIESPVLTPDQVLQETLESLQSATTISRRGITQLIAITVEATTAQKAADISNAIADTYVSDQVNAKVAMVLDIQKALLDRLNQASASLSQSESALNTFLTQHVDGAVGSGDRPDLADLRNRISAKEAENERLSSLVTSAQSDLANHDWQSIVDSIDSDQLRSLYNQRAQVANSLSQGTEAEGGVDLRARLRELDSQIDSQARGALAEIRNNLETSQQTEDALRKQLRDQIIQNELPKGDLVRLYEIQQEANVSRSVYQDLLNRTKAIDSQKNVQVPDSRVVSAALPPPRPSYPNTEVVLPLAGVFSLALGMGIAFLRENFVGGFVDEDQAEQVLGVPVISSLPTIPARESKLVSRTGVITEHPFSPYSEAIRRIRVFLELEAQARGRVVKVILVTSALPGEGKTQTAVSLARSFAIGGQRTLLVDCDLRRPSVHLALGASLERGLSDYLSRGSQPGALEGATVTDATTGLVVMLGVRERKFGTDMLFRDPSFAELLNRASAEFDYIVLDTSPVLPVVDARLLLQYSDAAVVVAKWASTSQRDVLTTVKELQRANTGNANIVAVLNRADSANAGYYGAY